jgi:hypothetical protein
MKKNQAIKYWYGVYKDYSEGTKIAQLCLSVDNLSCEILAKPGCLSFDFCSQRSAIRYAMELAKQEGCTLLELNVEKYRAIKIK